MAHIDLNFFWTSLEDIAILGALIAFTAICCYAAGIWLDPDYPEDKDETVRK